MSAESTPARDDLRARVSALALEIEQGVASGLGGNRAETLANVATRLRALLAGVPEPDTRGEACCCDQVTSRLFACPVHLAAVDVAAIEAEAEIRGQMKHITAEMLRGDQPLEAKEELIADLRARVSHMEAERDQARAELAARPAPAVAEGTDTRLTDAEREALVLAAIGYYQRSHRQPLDPAEVLRTDPGTLQVTMALDVVEPLVPAVERILAERDATRRDLRAEA